MGLGIPGIPKDTNLTHYFIHPPAAGDKSEGDGDNFQRLGDSIWNRQAENRRPPRRNP